MMNYWQITHIRICIVCWTYGYLWRVQHMQRWFYFVTTSLIGWVQAKISPDMVLYPPLLLLSVSQIPQCTSPIYHNAPFLLKCAHVCTFVLQNGALWIICLICEMGLLWYKGLCHDGTILNQLMVWNFNLGTLTLNDFTIWINLWVQHLHLINKPAQYWSSNTH